MFLTLSESPCHSQDSDDKTMSFSTLFKKASNFLGLASPDQLKPPPLDGEIIYCKNNVCVHPPAPLTLDVAHYPGYLTLKSQNDEISGPTLILTWIPNTSLRRNPSSIENSPNRSRRNSPRASPRKHARQEFAKADQIGLSSPSASMSPRGSTVSSCSEVMTNSFGGTSSAQAATAVSHDDTLSTTSSETSVSTSLRDERQSCESVEQGDDKSSRLSSSCRSQCDSGIGADEIAQLIQNNEKGGFSAGKVQGVGVNVNNLNSAKEVNLKHDPGRIIDQPTKDTDGENSPSTDSDGLTAEEQLAALLQRNKLEDKVRERKSSKCSVSIEMEGDKLVVVTQELEGQAETKSEDTDVNINPDSLREDTASLQSTDLDCPSVSSDSTDPSPTGEHYQAILGELNATTTHPAKVTAQNTSPYMSSPDQVTSKPDQGDATPVTGSSSQSSSSKATPKATPNLSLDLKNTTAPSSSGCTPTPDISVTRYRMSSSSSTTTSGPDSSPPSPFSSPEHSAGTSPMFLCPDTPSECSSLSADVSHNLTFPDNSISYSKERSDRRTARDQVCGVFSVNLSQMRSLRLFYSDKECTRGQVVIASRESQYKILHFHHGGLDRLAEIFQDWSLFAQDQDKKKDGESPYRQFLIVRPQITDDQCHPEEGLFETVTEDMWRTHMNELGQIEDVFQLRKAIFFGGLDASIRQEAWPFLLQYYPFSSTFEEREVIRNDKFIEYQNIRKKRESMSEEEMKVFWRTIQCTVEKDVVRTDRSHPYFRGEDNPNIEVLKNILLNYAVAHPNMGYTQGMSDLLAPVLAEIQHEAGAYWCFVGLMQRTIFFSSPRDTDMDKQLNHLRELLKVMLPKFYRHLEKLGQDAMELLFCHRWILLCFKREFPEADALRMWESCWAHYQTDYFHLFLCVAIIAIYGDDIIEQDLPADEVLLHFSSLAMHMNGDVVLRKARGLLHQFRSLPRIPCSLHGLCLLCSPGMWDSGHVPAVHCVGNHPDGECPYHSQPNSPEEVTQPSGTA